jgi:hypothetical protein
MVLPTFSPVDKETLSWVEDILAIIMLLNWESLDGNPDVVRAVWPRVFAFHDRSGRAPNDVLFTFTEAEFPESTAHERILHVSSIYETSAEEMRLDYQTFVPPTPTVPVIQTPRFFLTLAKDRSTFSVRTMDTLAAAGVVPPLRSSSLSTPYWHVVDTLKQILAEDDCATLLPTSLMALFAPETQSPGLGGSTGFGGAVGVAATPSQLYVGDFGGAKFTSNAASVFSGFG